jgi:hypothetical protein
MNCCDDKQTAGQAKSTGVAAWLQGSRKWWLLAAVAVAGGLTFGWETLVVFGIAPLLVSLLPCLVMCALGVCMMKCKDKGGKTADAAAAAAQPKDGPVVVEKQPAAQSPMVARASGERA